MAPSPWRSVPESDPRRDAGFGRVTHLDDERRTSTISAKHNQDMSIRRSL